MTSGRAEVTTKETEQPVYHFTAQVDESCDIVFETEYETDTLVVYEDYYYPKGDEYTVTKKTYRLKGMDNTFSLPVSRRSDIQDEYATYRRKRTWCDCRKLF